MTPWCFARTFALGLLISLFGIPCALSAETNTVVLRGENGAAAEFQKTEAGCLWTAYVNDEAGERWKIAGPRFSVQMPDGNQANLDGAGSANIVEQQVEGAPQIVLETVLPRLPVAARQTFSFCKDGRTLRIQTALRATGGPVTIQRVGLLEIAVDGQSFRLTGPDFVSSPIFGNRVFAGIEHPSALCQANGGALSLVQPSCLTLGPGWADLPSAVFGSVSRHDFEAYGENEGLRRAFLTYLDTVRVKPRDMHVHYNDWWTAPVPSSESFVLDNIAALKAGLYDQTRFFFDSYALDMGWSDSHTVWAIDAKNFPEGFTRVRDALAAIHSRPGLWVSPSSLYPPALDNPWLESAGYETVPPNNRAACMAVGGKYQTAFKNAVLRHAKAANLAHMKFDGFVPRCDAEGHGHPAGPESCLSLAQGLLEVFDALRAQDPGIALEPTCFGYHPSPWWLVHVPFIIGPFGDDSPRGRCPCPDWLESMTTARDIENLKGRDAFLMPSAALQCFDIIVQCPGPFQNHAAMAIGRGRWFVSSYINPKFMDAGEWRFFADLIAWARENRDFLQEPVLVGGDPSQRQAYGYAFLGAERRVLCLRNPWIEETTITLPEHLQAAPFAPATEFRMLYPCREILARVPQGEPMPSVALGPYDTVFVEMAASSQGRVEHSTVEPRVTWKTKERPRFTRIVFDEDPAPFGPSWTCPDGDVKEKLVFEAAGRLTVRKAISAELCVLCEGGPEVARASCVIRIDGREAPSAVSTSVGAFAATGNPAKGEWTWFLARFPEGRHRVHVEVAGIELGREESAKPAIAVFIRGASQAPLTEPPFTPGRSFPLYHPGERSWSRTLVAPVQYAAEAAAAKKRARRIERIEGVYLDTLDWVEATAGWGEVHRNRSIMGETMTMGGRRFHRGIGAHAASRVVYAIPAGYKTFAATIGYDQEVRNGSIVFVVNGDGRELFRSSVIRYENEPETICVPIEGLKELTLIVEDAGDGIGADHADWADARLLN